MDYAIVGSDNIVKFRETKIEGREFIQFYDKVTQTSYEIGTYQCKVVEEAKKYLDLKEIK